MDGLADVPAPGEKDCVDPGVRRQQRTDRTRALHEVEDARRDSGLDEAARVHLGRVWRDLARFEYDGVAAGERGQDVAVRQMHGEIERTQHRRDAERAETAFGVRLPGRREASDELQPVIDGDGGFRAAGLRLGSRLPQRLADVERDRARDLLLARGKHLADVADERRALRERPQRPRRLGGSRGADRAFDLVERPAMPAEHDAEIGG